VRRIPECETGVDANDFAQRVEKKAYELYVRKGSQSGHEWDDWFEAEKIVGSEISTVDKDCIRSESFYKISHQFDPLPSEIDTQSRVIPRYN
jgi:hypothetical protein